jgi:hypothetical protein
MSKHAVLILALALFPGCLAQTEPGSDPTPEPVCGWQDNPETFTETCPAPFAFSSSKRFEVIDDGASACWFYETICVTPGAVLDECRRTHVTCQPTDRTLGRP